MSLNTSVLLGTVILGLSVGIVMHPTTTGQYKPQPMPLSAESLKDNWDYACTTFPITADGYMATAGHCVKDSGKMSVFINGEEYPAKLVAANYTADVAITHIDYKFDSYLKIAHQPNADRDVYILGYPLIHQLGEPVTMTHGQWIRKDGNDELIAGGSCEGNSGGPVVNSSNAVVGVLVAGLGDQPCSYYSIGTDIQNLEFLAQMNNVHTEKSTDQHQYLSQDVLNTVGPITFTMLGQFKDHKTPSLVESVLLSLGV